LVKLDYRVTYIEVLQKILKNIESFEDKQIINETIVYLFLEIVDAHNMTGALSKKLNLEHLL